MKHYYQGRYKPENPKKYAGNVNEITYRSGWELQLMIKLDRSDSVVLWNSEGFNIPYRSPVDGKIHRYWPDFTVQIRNKSGVMKTWLLEVKPHSQTELRTVNRKTRKYITEVATFATNQAKWAAAKEFCDEQGWEFQVVTEKTFTFV
jgi:hypothetical protein